jgi:rubrerythrin
MTDQGDAQDQRDFVTVALELAAKDRLDVPELELLFRLECSGEDFYDQLAARVHDAAAAELFRRNGREELGHARRVGRAIAIKQGAPFTGTTATAARFPVSLPDELPVEMLPLVVQGELDGDAGYQRWADNEPDPAVQQLLRRNGREESLHGRRVTAAIALLEQVAPPARVAPPAPPA